MLRKQPLTRCPACKVHAVVPIMDECVHNEESGRWLLSLLCTACRMHREVLVTQEQANDFDRALDDEARKLTAAIRRWSYKSMEDDICRFVAACEADQVWPEDFVR